MNYLKKVYKHLNKENLSTQRVELAIELGGIKSMASKLKSNIKSYNRKFSTLDDLVRELQSEAKDLDKRTDSFYKEVKEVKKEGEQQAKELGFKFIDTPVGKTVNDIETSILSGELDTIKKGLRIKI